MPYVSENEKFCKQLEDNTKDRERLQAENSRLRKRISTTEVQNRLQLQRIISLFVILPSHTQFDLSLVFLFDQFEPFCFFSF
jgi:hypothetical protein